MEPASGQVTSDRKTPGLVKVNRINIRSAEDVRPSVLPASCVSRVADLLFDLFGLGFYVGDVVADVLITLRFQSTDLSIFFALSTAVIFVAQILGTIYFVWLFGSHKSRAAQLGLVLGLLPFSLLLPILTLLHSWDWTCIKCLFSVFGLRRLDDAPISASEDPLHRYLSRKLRSHGGFLIESLVESVPTAIMQMIAYVLSGQGDVPTMTVFAVSTGVLTLRTFNA